MLVFKGYGIVMKRIERTDLPLIRYWRNHPLIQSTMDYREYITPKMQENWFESIHNPYNYYYLMYDEAAPDKPYGVINIKNAENMREAEGGIFVWENSFWKSFKPSIFSIGTLDFCFHVLPDTESSVIHILKNNNQVISYNKLLGYVLAPGQENNFLQKYILYKDVYLEKSIRLRKALMKITGCDGSISIYGEPSEYNNDVINKLLIEAQKTKNPIIFAL